MNLTKYLGIATLAASMAVLGCSKDEKESGNKDQEKASKVEISAKSAKADEKPGAHRTMKTPGNQPKNGADDPMTPGTPSNKLAASVNTTPGPNAADAGFDIFHKDMDAVVGANLWSVRGNPIYGVVKPLLMAQLAKQSEGKYASYVSACGLDPVETVSSIMIGTRMDSDNKDYLIAIAGVDKNQLQTCLEGIGKLAGKEVKVENNGNLTTLVNSKGKPMDIAWADEKTMLFAPQMPREQLLARASGKDGITGDALMKELLGKVDTKASIWMAGTPKMDDDDDVPIEVKGMYVSLDLSQGLGLNAGIRLADAAAAKAGVAKLQAEIDRAMKEMKGNPFASMAGPYLQTLKMTAEGPYVTMTLSIGADDYQKFMGMVGGLLQLAARR